MCFFDILYFAILPFILPKYIKKFSKETNRWLEYLIQRLYISSNQIVKNNLSNALTKNRKTIWFHAVSVGEVLSLRKLINEISNRFNIVLTTTTLTGFKTAQRNFDKVSLLYSPLDFGFSVNNCIKLVKPNLVCLVEQEFWPNLLLQLRRRKIPVIVINTRFSTKTFQLYEKHKAFFNYITRDIKLFCAPSKISEEKLKALGIKQDRIKLTGNIKIDNLIIDRNNVLSQGYRQDLENRISAGDNEQHTKDMKIIVAGSTHQGEEEIILEAYLMLRQKIRHLKLIVAPRHIIRTKEIENLMQRNNIRYSLYSRCRILNAQSQVSSKITDQNHMFSTFNSQDVIIVDVLGILMSFYAVCDVAIVGGSFVNRGGHNILEPVVFGKPVIFGPYIYNFQNEANELISRKIGFMVRNKDELVNTIDILIAGSEGEEFDMRAKKYLSENTKATESILEELQKYLN